MAVDPLTAALEFGRTAIDKIWPDASEAERQKVTALLTVFSAQAEIVKTEASSNNFLTASWRPILMLTFGGLIVARWFGIAAPNLSPEEYLKLWDIVELGIGGYVIGRSFEKVAPAISGALKK